MAYARQADPILQSLSEVGQNIRGLSGDILTRRRLDLTEGQQIAEAERERNLQSLKAQALQQEGKVKVLETTGKLAEAEHRMELDTKKFGLETEKHALQQRLGEFQIKEGEALLPGKMAEQQANVIARKAQAASLYAGARVNALQAQEIETKMSYMNTPLSPAGFAAMAETIGGEAGLRLATEVIQPGDIKTVGSAMFAMKVIEQADPQRTNEILLNRLTTQMAQMEPGSPEYQAAERQRQMALQNAGRAASQPKLDNDKAYIAALSKTYAEASQALNTGESQKARVLASQILEAKQRASLHMKPEQLQEFEAREHEVFSQFEGIATEMATKIAKKEDFDTTDTRFKQYVQQYKEQLAVEHGDIRAYTKYLELTTAAQADKTVKARPGTTPTATPAAPMTPQLSRIREIQGKQIETDARQHFKRLTSGQNLELSGLAGVTDLAGAEELYVKIRRDNPTMGAGQAMQQLRQQLTQGR